MTALSIIQDACRRLSLSVPTTAAQAAGDSTEGQMFALLNQEGRELARRGAWQALVREKTFVSVNAETQPAVIPPDFDKFLNDTFYNRTRKRQVLGPFSAQEWQAQKAITATVVYDCFRVRGNAVLMIPIPPVGHTYAFEYVSKYWALSPAGVEQAAFAADNDTTYFEEEFLTLGLLWRWKQAKGFDYAEEFNRYEFQVTQALARDGGRRRINFGKNTTYDRPRYPGVVEGSWQL